MRPHCGQKSNPSAVALAAWPTDVGDLLGNFRTSKTHQTLEYLRIPEEVIGMVPEEDPAARGKGGGKGDGRTTGGDVVARVVARVTARARARVGAAATDAAVVAPADEAKRIESAPPPSCHRRGHDARAPILPERPPRLYSIHQKQSFTRAYTCTATRVASVRGSLLFTLLLFARLSC